MCSSCISNHYTTSQSETELWPYQRNLNFFFFFFFFFPPHPHTACPSQRRDTPSPPSPPKNKATVRLPLFMCLGTSFISVIVSQEPVVSKDTYNVSFQRCWWGCGWCGPPGGPLAPPLPPDTWTHLMGPSSI